MSENKDAQSVVCTEGQSYTDKHLETDSKSGTVENPASDTVRSANSWEKADLGDVDRRQKFLRLMGASKKAHHGKFVIGDKKERNKDDPEELNKKLEDQFSQGMEHRLVSGKRGHLGLGFHAEQEETTKTQDPAQDAEQESINTHVDDKDSKLQENRETSEKASTLDQNPKESQDEEPSDPKKRKFVEGNS